MAKQTDKTEKNQLLGEKTLYFLIFSLILASWLFFGLALAGLFSASFLKITFLLCLLAGFWRLRKNICPLSEVKNFLWRPALIFPFLAFIFTLLFSSPTIFSGRDQGSLSEAAIRLAQNGKLPFSSQVSQVFFEINPLPREKFNQCLQNSNQNLIESLSKILKIKEKWCAFQSSGRALNFPGFHFTHNGQLLVQFPAPYIAWLAAFFVLFGLWGIILANAVWSAVFFLFFYLTSRTCLEKKTALIVTALAFTAFPFLWFAKFSLSENMALALFWVALFGLLNYLKKPDSLQLWLFLSTITLLFFVRVEGLILLPIGLGIILANKSARLFLLQQKKNLIILAFLFLLFAALSLTNSYPYYKEMARAAFSSLSQLNTTAESPNCSFCQVLKTFYFYGLIPFLLLGVTGIILVLRQKKWLLLVPLWLAMPTFIYFLDPQISDDHPWLLRRFVFCSLSILVFYSAFFLEKISPKMIYVCLAAVLFFSLPVSVYYNFDSENNSLLNQTNKISQKLEDADLVLIARLSSGDNWTMLSGPLNFLFGKPAVYFFNPEDLKKIDSTLFSKIVLVASAEDMRELGLDNPFWQERLKKIEELSIKTNRLEKVYEENIDKLPRWEKKEIKTTLWEIR